MLRPLAAAALLAAATTTMAIAHDGHDHAADRAEAGQGAHTLGDLTIARAFSRATLPGAPVAGGFLAVTNAGTTDDRLVSAATGAAGRVEIHEMAADGDVMRMRELPDGLPVPAGETVELKPGGYHLMFMDLTAPLVEGAVIEVVLTFETAGEISVPLRIGAPNARSMEHGAMHGHDTPSDPLHAR